MERHETTIEDETLYVEDGAGGRLEVGTLADVYELAGGETYDIEYDERHAAYFDWVDADDHGVMTIDVREALSEMTYPPAFVEKLTERSLDPVEGDTFPERTVYFVEVMTDVWSKKGNFDDDENPFI